MIITDAIGTILLCIAAIFFSKWYSDKSSRLHSEGVITILDRLPKIDYDNPYFDQMADLFDASVPPHGAPFMTDNQFQRKMNELEKSRKKLDGKIRYNNVDTKIRSLRSAEKIDLSLGFLFLIIGVAILSGDHTAILLDNIYKFLTSL